MPMLTLLALFACKDDPPPDLPIAIVDDSGEHWLDTPFPSDSRREADGTIDLSDFPASATELGTTITGGWARQAGEAVSGFSHLAAVYFRFDRALEVDADYPAGEGSAVRLFSLDSDHEVPVQTRFIADPKGDPFYAANVLAIAPDPRHPLRSGERYLAMVDDTLATSADGWSAPDGAPENAAVATVFTVQDSLGQLQTLYSETMAVLDQAPETLDIQGLKEVSTLEYAQGSTPSGNDATVVTVTFADASTEVFYMGPDPSTPGQTIDLTADAMQVWQGTIQTVAWQDLAAQPYASAGIGLLGDFNRSGDGWITFDADGTLENSPTLENMRVTIQVPRDVSPRAVMTWDHGTGGSAYNAVQRIRANDLGGQVRSRLAAEGVVLVSRDQPLYGTRYPLIDEGFSASLGFYNVGNLPAFRDNQRQAAVDHMVLQRFIDDELEDVIGSELPGQHGAFGHSLGSVTAHLGLAGQQGAGADAGLMSGTGGYFTYYILATGLLGTDNDVVGMIAPLIDGDLDGAGADELVAALIGLPEEAWGNMDRFHPVMGLFQVIMDGSDPIALAPTQVRPEVIVLGVDDLQVPNLTTEWLAEALPDAEVITCEKQGEYDGHSCTYREEVGLQSFTDFGAAL